MSATLHAVPDADTYSAEQFRADLDALRKFATETEAFAKDTLDTARRLYRMRFEGENFGYHRGKTDKQFAYWLRDQGLTVYSDTTVHRMLAAVKVELRLEALAKITPGNSVRPGTEAQLRYLSKLNKNGIPAGAIGEAWAAAVANTQQSNGQPTRAEVRTAVAEYLTELKGMTEMPVDEPDPRALVATALVKIAKELRTLEATAPDLVLDAIDRWYKNLHTVGEL